MSLRFNKRLQIAVGLVLLVLLMAWLGAKLFLSAAFQQGPSAGPFTADAQCPRFRASYPQCTVAFGNRGLSTLNSVFETFVGEGAFEIKSFQVSTAGAQRFDITDESNRGTLRSRIQADGVVRLGQDRENEVVYRSHESAFCDAGRIYELQTVFVDGDLNVQNLEYWTEGEALRFRLFQNGAPTADVTCR
jgi:hypothetical protein